MQYSVSHLNQLGQMQFVALLGGLFEQTPQIAALAWQKRPFQDWQHLFHHLITTVVSLPDSEQVRLIRVHPDLGSRLKMAEASVREQVGAGLDQLTSAEYQLFQAYNQQYQEYFGFPFIIAVRNHTKASILQAFTERMLNERLQEQCIAIAEIIEIARWRLLDIVSTDTVWGMSR